MKQKQYLLDTCICAYWLRDKKNVREYINAVGFDLYAEEKARLAMAGTPTGEFDLLIGCTAVAKDMIFVTENVKDFQNIQGIQIENWIKKDRQQ